jgi:hypothetical protein
MARSASASAACRLLSDPLVQPPSFTSRFFAAANPCLVRWLALSALWLIFNAYFVFD